MSVRTDVALGARPKLTGRAALLLVLVTVLGVFLMMPMREYLSERGHIAELERQAQTLEDANTALRTQIARLQDPAEIERLARECLGMVMPGEIAFVTTPRGSDNEPSDC
jgi:cell division protein FtsB